jgi:hypothetical protein
MEKRGRGERGGGHAFMYAVPQRGIGNRANETGAKHFLFRRFFRVELFQRKISRADVVFFFTYISGRDDYCGHFSSAYGCVNDRAGGYAFTRKEGEVVFEYPFCNRQNSDGVHASIVLNFPVMRFLSPYERVSVLLF